MPELGRKLGLVEVLNPLGIGVPVAPLEFPDGFGESAVTCLGTAQPSESTRSMVWKWDMRVAVATPLVPVLAARARLAASRKRPV
jgi:hypothetical protein